MNLKHVSKLMTGGHVTLMIALARCVRHVPHAIINVNVQMYSSSKMAIIC